jgi:FtsP/CotA-like multicopper oxidase with cupredoxin domain
MAAGSSRRNVAGRFTRRQVASAGIAALGVSALAGGSAGLVRGTRAQSVGEPHPALATTSAGPNPWQEPPVLMSVDGLLDVTLEAKPLPGAGIGKMAYNGLIPGPTLRFRPGDTVRLKLTNNLDSRMTNMHVHGLHVSPEGNSDNIFQLVDSGESFQYEYQIPRNHQPGSYWYHPHHHGDAQEQVNGGLAGAIVIEGAFDKIEGIEGLPERLFVLQGPSSVNGELVYTVNGVVNPAVAMRPGQTQRWRLLNASANAYFNLALDGHTLHQIATDGNPLPSVQSLDQVLLGPAERAEVLVQGADAGTYTFKSLEWGGPAQHQPSFTVATVTVAGSPMEPMSLPEKLIQLPDLSQVEIAQQREIVFQENTMAPVFTINGATFDPSVVNTMVKLGTTEEWILRNTSPDAHPFHIHVEDFQVMSIDGAPQPFSYQDTVNLPPRSSVVIRIPFLDFTGKFVYHCHILAHEDFGMMSVIEVVE